MQRSNEKKQRSDTLQTLNNKANVVDIVVSHRSHSLTSADLRIGVPLLMLSTNNVHDISLRSLSPVS